MREGAHDAPSSCFRDKSFYIDFPDFARILDQWLEREMFRLVVLFLVALWLLGLIIDIGGILIHMLLVIAAIILILNILNGRRSMV